MKSTQAAALVTIYPPGMAFSANGFDAEILSVTISQRGVSYLCGWWEGATWHSAEIPESQIVSPKTKQQPLGFRIV